MFPGEGGGIGGGGGAAFATFDEGFRDAGGGIGGFLPIGGGAGFGLGGMRSDVECDGCAAGRRLLFSAATLGGTGAAPGGGGGAPGGLGAEPLGIGGAAARGGGAGLEALRDVVSGSESYAPVLIPPDFLSLGMPPANRPPSCGAGSMAAAPDPPLCPWSLLLLARLGAGGRRPGTGGAPPAGGPALLFGLLSRMGADRSFTCVTFLSFAPLLMSLRSAPWHRALVDFPIARACPPRSDPCPGL